LFGIKLASNSLNVRKKRIRIDFWDLCTPRQDEGVVTHRRNCRFNIHCLNTIDCESLVAARRH
jgi:hypothetical protein